MKLLIIGGGIGGLALAIALRNKGMQADVYERAPQLGEIGSGVVLTPNGMKALDKLGHGIGAYVRSSGLPYNRQAAYPFLTETGKVISTADFGDFTEKFGAPLVTIERSVLHAALYEVLRNDGIYPGRKLSKFEQNEEGVIAYFDGGEIASGHALIGADGLYSAVRAQMFGMEKPRFLGMTSVRGIAQGLDHPLAETGFLTLGRGAQVITSPLRDRKLYWTATFNAPEGVWIQFPVEKAKRGLLERLREWHEPVQQMIELTRPEDITVSDIRDRSPILNWSDRRVTLLGDAAHPMTPFIGQGANMALEDSLVLADRLAEHSDPETAFYSYQIARVERANKLVNQSFQMAVIGRLENPLLCKSREFIMTLMGKFADIDKRNAWLYGYNP